MMRTAIKQSMQEMANKLLSLKTKITNVFIFLVYARLIISFSFFSLSIPRIVGGYNIGRKVNKGQHT